MYENSAGVQGAFVSPRTAQKGRLAMRKTILTILATALLTATTVQFAAAAERHQGRKAVRLTTPASDPFRNSNAAWPAQQVQPDWSRYTGGYSAPAGH
jgi:hypothetical protein